MSVYSFLCPLFTAGGLCRWVYVVAGKQAAAFTLARARRWCSQCRHPVQEARPANWRVGSKSAAELNFLKDVTNLQDREGKKRQCGFPLRSVLDTLRQLVLRAERLFALTESVCRISSLSFVPRGPPLAGGHKWC